MGFKIKKTKKQRIVGAIMMIVFLLVIVAIAYFMPFFFSLSSSSHEGEKIIESDWKVVITDGFGYNAPQGVIFSFKGNGRFTIKYEDGEKIANGFYKLKVNKKDEIEPKASGTIKLLTLPFGQNFPEEWDMNNFRSDIEFKFIYLQTDKEGKTIYEDHNYNIMSDTMEFQTTGAIFQVVRDGSEEADAVVTSTGAAASDDAK